MFFNKNSLLSKRSLKFFWQRRTRGWSDDETWNLFHEIATFTLPRLKRFKELNNGYPSNLTPQEWDDILDKMIFAFEEIVHEDDLDRHEGESRGKMINRLAKIQEGCKLFGKYFQHLWW